MIYPESVDLISVSLEMNVSLGRFGSLRDYYFLGEILVFLWIFFPLLTPSCLILPGCLTVQLVGLDT